MVPTLPALAYNWSHAYPDEVPSRPFLLPGYPVPDASQGALLGPQQLTPPGWEQQPTPRGVCSQQACVQCSAEGGQPCVEHLRGTLEIKQNSKCPLTQSLRYPQFQGTHLEKHMLALNKVLKRTQGIRDCHVGTTLKRLDGFKAEIWEGLNHHQRVFGQRRRTPKFWFLLQCQYAQKSHFPSLECWFSSIVHSMYKSGGVSDSLGKVFTFDKYCPLIPTQDLLNLNLPSPRICILKNLRWFGKHRIQRSSRSHLAMTVYDVYEISDRMNKGSQQDAARARQTHTCEAG